jgi:hypothetical protein
MELAGSTQNQERMTRTPNQPNKITIFLKKSSSKVKRSPKFVLELTNGACRLNPNSRKNYQNTKSTK